ncbi:MAG: hypothetical protein OS130_00070 [Thermodesulfobacteriota bacterium]|jgi:hypothetical protein|nr:MAG: hypothetical protein OS130_00070 [Thermodesulfobacteriota bacterium]
MPDYRRAFVPGATYFFTVTTWHQQPVLVDKFIRKALGEAVSVVWRAEEWPYSTFHRYVEKRIYSADWGGSQEWCDDNEFGE